MNDWDTGLALNSWRGITVENSRVTALNLGLTFYVYSDGNLPNTVADLDALTELVMESTSKLTPPGPLPPDIASLSGLTSLKLYHRELTGQIPANIGDLTGLIYLALDANQLSGPLPASLGNLTNLTQFFLSGNRFSGQIPNRLGGLTAMTTTHFLLNDNLLSGCVPAGWSKYLSVINPQHDASGNDVTLPLCVGAPTKPTGTPKNNVDIEVTWTTPSGTPNWYQIQWRPCQVTPEAIGGKWKCVWRTDTAAPWQPAWTSWEAPIIGMDGKRGGQAVVTSSPTVIGETTNRASWSGDIRGGVPYQVRVRAHDNFIGYGAWSEPSDMLWSTAMPDPDDPPGAPTGIGVSNDSNTRTITVDWTRPADETGAIGYGVQCSKDNGATWTACDTVITVAATTNVDLRATGTYPGPTTNNTPNKVRVQSVRHGQTSAWVEAGIGDDPSNLSTSYASTGITVSWQKPNQGASYSYHLDSSADGTTWTRQKTVASIGNANPSETITTSSSAVAQVRVRAIDSANTASSWLEATVPGLSNIGSQIQGTTLKLRWDRPSGASGAIAYTVECNDSASGGTWSACTTVAATSDSTVTASVSNKGSVKRVRVNAGPTSVSGPWTVASVPSLVPGAPASVTVTIEQAPPTMGGDYTNVQWTKPAGSTATLSYEITCSDDNGATWTYCGTYTHTSSNLSANFSGKDATTNVRVLAIWDGLRGPAASWAKTPGAPGDVGAQVQGTTLKLRWDRPSVASGNLSYTVGCNNSASGGTWDDTCHTVSASSNASFSASVTNKGSVQRVRVKATQSSVDGAWTTVSVPSGVPGAISALGAQLPDGGTTLKVRWDKPSGSTVALDYAVECNNTASGNTGWTSCHTVNASSNASFTASLSGQGSVKRVRARAERDGLQGAWTSGTVPSGLPAAPSSLSLTKQGTTSKATVGKPSGVSGAVTYRVHCSTDNGATWTACNVTSSSSDASHEILLPSSATNANAVRARVEKDGLVSVWLRHPAKLTASTVTDTTATLTLEGHTAAWYYKATSGPHTTCQGPVAAGTFSKGLTGLSGNATYTYSAYSDAACTTLLATASAFTTLSLTASSVLDTSATLTIANHAGAWYYQADVAPDTACTGPVNTATQALSGLTPSTTYTYKAYSDSGCTTANLLASAAAFTTTASLTASGITTTTATLTIAGHTAQWWYDANTGPDTSCQGPVAANDATDDLTGLTAGTTYTYKAYSATGCNSADEIASETFTAAVTVGSIDTNSNSSVFVGRSFGTLQAGAQAFTTGSNAGGYTLTSISGSFSQGIGNPGDIAVKLHAASGTNPGTEQATLNGSNPTATGQYTYTCSSGCALAADTTYFVVMNTPNVPATGSNRYLWLITALDSETKTPSTNGWSIADDGRVSNVANLTSWTSSGGTYQIVVTAVPE